LQICQFCGESRNKRKGRVILFTKGLIRRLPTQELCCDNRGQESRIVQLTILKCLQKTLTRMQHFLLTNDKRFDSAS
jgi:hypothetical protein